MIPPEPTTTTPRPIRLWALTLVASILAGLGAFAIQEAVGRRFIPEPRMVRTQGGPQNIPTVESNNRAERKNSLVWFAILGGCPGLMLGLAGGLARGSARAGFVAAVAGVLLGSSVGAAASACFVPTYQRMLERAPEEEGRDLTMPILMHAGIWACIGAAAGTALGIGLGDARRIPSILTGGLAGGALAAAAFQVVGAFVFLNDTTQPIQPERLIRLIVALTGSMLVAAIACFAATSRSRRRPVATETSAVSVPVADIGTPSA